ncbi:MAG TPA: ribosome maturation factor RimP [Candidatus Omnitrophota bacterium]|nr:ribosome maturation factor RimP [Candidatus Omnitrophota bacterium]HPT06770.1 ribosome maturation factor RimP [Candidatus Omnitrophota bacterium]
MDIQSQVERIHELSAPILNSIGVELVDARISNVAGRTTVTLFVDKPGGGITLEECGNLNRQICEALDTVDLFAGSYVVEVSSPGIDRPLKTKADFTRAISKAVRFFLSEKVNGKLEWAGQVLRVDDSHVYIAVDGQELAIALSFINKARYELLV